jgi:hypothetical protein
MEAKNMMKLEENLKIKSEIEELIENIELVESLSAFDPPPSDLIRRKRQATSINCTALPIQLAIIQQNISTTQIRITNTTITLNSVNKQYEIYKVRVATANSTSNWNLFNVYVKLLSGTNSTLENAKKQLASAQATENQIKNDIAIYCTGTGRPAITSPCGKHSILLKLFFYSNIKIIFQIFRNFCQV